LIGILLKMFLFFCSPPCHWWLLGCG
jgi:hypothetical protein